MAGQERMRSIITSYFHSPSLSTPGQNTCTPPCLLLAPPAPCDWRLTGKRAASAARSSAAGGWPCAQPADAEYVGGGGDGSGARAQHCPSGLTWRGGQVIRGTLSYELGRITTTEMLTPSYTTSTFMLVGSLTVSLITLFCSSCAKYMAAVRHGDIVDV